MKYQIYFHDENSSEVQPFTDIEFDDPMVAITAVRDIRKHLNVQPCTIILVNDDQGDMVHQNFVDCGMIKEWTRPGVMSWL